MSLFIEAHQPASDDEGFVPAITCDEIKTIYKSARDKIWSPKKAGEQSCLNEKTENMKNEMDRMDLKSLREVSVRARKKKLPLTSRAPGGRKRTKMCKLSR